MKLKEQLDDFRLTTAQVLYRLPDHPSLLQEFIWQTMDKAPDFPRIRKFLRYWEENLEGRLHMVRISALEVIWEGKWRQAQGVFRLN